MKRGRGFVQRTSDRCDPCGLCNEGRHRDDGGGRDAGGERASESKAVEITLFEELCTGQSSLDLVPSA